MWFIVGLIIGFIVGSIVWSVKWAHKHEWKEVGRHHLYNIYNKGETSELKKPVTFINYQCSCLEFKEVYLIGHVGKSTDKPKEKDIQHKSDCAVHNEPASPNEPCNCGAV